IEHMDWERCVEHYDRPHTLFYCDPPYWGTEGYGVDFPLAEYERMAQLTTSMQGKMIISVNDIPEMRKAFEGLEMQSVGIKYNLQTTEKAKPKRELVIRNF
ncbi:TPA: DNA adenine methylase, partial [Salmonella enterica subsp. enterica]